MFKKIFEYAGPYKKNMYVATVVVLVSVLMGVLPFVLAYQVISPLVMGDSVETEFVLLRVIGVLICLVLQAFFYGWGLSISHKAAYNTLFRLRVSLQEKFEKLPLGIVEEKGTGTIKKLFVDDVDSLELLLAHSVPEGIANLLIPLVIYVAMFCADWKLALMSLASIPISLLSMVIMYSVGMKRMGPYYQSAQKMNNTIIEYINGIRNFLKHIHEFRKIKKLCKSGSGTIAGSFRSQLNSGGCFTKGRCPAVKMGQIFLLKCAVLKVSHFSCLFFLLEKQCVLPPFQAGTDETVHHSNYRSDTV